ncbi:MAG: insulinase family protein [Acidobacteria bacterium]|nr:insulinase family protein [Acidobacteriota bacterium]
MNRHNRFQILLLLLIILPCFCYSQARKPAKKPAAVRDRPLFLQQAKSFEETPFVTRLVLRNGLTILIEENRTQPVISIQTIIRAGSFHEPSQDIGVARLLASMLERGPGEKAGGTLRQNVYSLGGIIRRSVDYENSRFEILAPSSQWKQALSLQANALLNAELDSDGLVEESYRAFNEARDALDHPAESAKEKLLELAYGQSRMGKLSELTIDVLQKIKRENLKDFYQASYTPSATVLAISGDVTPGDVLNEVARIYGKSAASSSKRMPTPGRELQSGFRYRAIPGDTAIPNVLFGFRAVPENAEDFRALEVLAAILGLGEGSVLNSRLRDQMGIIWTQETHLLAESSFGYLMIRMEVDSANIDRSQIAALTEIELLKRQEPDKAEVLRAQAQLELDYWKNRENAAGRAEALAYYELLGDWKRGTRYIAEIKKVEPSDIKRVANKYLRLEQCSLLEYLPASDAARNTTAEGVLQTLEGLLEGSADEEQAKREKETVPFLKVPKSVESFRYSQVQYPFQMASILRGPDMFIREDHTAPIIEMGLFFRGGKFAEKPGNTGITRLMLQLMAMGTKDFAGRHFNRQLEIFGARVQPIIDDDYFGILFSTLSGNFAAGFDLLQQAIKSPVFDKEDVDRLKESQKKMILKRNSGPDFSQDLMMEALFTDFPYSRNDLGTEASLSAITPGALVEWHAEHVKNRKPFIVIIGDSKGTSLTSHFVRNFSGSRMRDSGIPDEWTKALEESKAIEKVREKNRSLILIGFQAPPMDDEDIYAAKVLEKLVEIQSLRLSAISEGPDTAYKLSAAYSPRFRGGSFTVFVEAAPGSEEKALNSLKNTIRQTVDEPIPYREFRSAIHSAAGVYQVMNEARRDQIRRVAENLMAGKRIEAFLNFASDVQMVKVENLAEAAKRILNLDKAAVICVRGKPEK